jgi:acetoacetyl-CoA synthetase
MASPTPRKLWEHPDPKSTRMWKFMIKANERYGLKLNTFNDLYEWSVGDTRTDFWNLVWEEINLIHEGTYSKVVDTNARMDSIPKWFEGVRLNYAENMLFTRGTESTGQRTTFEKEDNKVAVTQVREGATEIQEFTWGELRRRAGLLSNAMRARGVRKGDRIGLVASNSVDTLTVLLATTTIGAIFGSSSTDMGTKGILDRLVQIRPNWVFMDDAAVYNGKTTDLRPKITEIVHGLRDVQEFQGIVTLPRFAYSKDVSWVPRCLTLGTFLEAANGNSEPRFERTEYADPFLIVW